MGSGSKKAKIMVVGEAPGEREDEKHRAFVGPAGQLLDQLLSEVGISRKDCYITNVAKCRPRDNRTPERKEVKICVENYFQAEWARVRPDFVLLLGNSALQGVLGKSGITKHRGTPINHDGATVLPAFHPAYALRNPRMLPALKADIQRFRRLLHNEESPAGKTIIKSIRSAAHLKWLLRRLKDAEEFSFDVETNLNTESKEYYQYWEEGFRIVSIAFTLEEGTSYVVPLYHADSPWKDPLAVLGLLRPYLEGGVRSRDKGSAGGDVAVSIQPRTVAHNGKFDVQALGSFGIRIRLSFDTMLAAHMLDENRLKGLKPLSEIDLAADGYKIQTDDRKIDYTNLPWRQVAVYNGKDTDYTLRLYHLFRKDLRNDRRSARVFVKLMMPASDMLVRVERRGIYIDPERLADRYAIAQRNLAKIRGYISDKGAGPINLNSPQQVARWLFGDKEEGGLDLPIIETTGKGSPSTREAVILRLAREYPPVRALLKYRQWAKYESTYLRPWLARRDSHSRYHTSYKLFGTVTGRLSGDFQQVPRDSFIRSIVGAPPGWVFVTADFSQIELRIAAMLANERRMLRTFSEGGDLHLTTAVDATGKRAHDITSEERKKAKAVNFGFLYGMGWRKFVSYAFENYGVDVDEYEAQRFRDRFFESYPALRPWHERQRRIVHKFGRVYSPIGRARHLPDVYSRDRNVAAEAERQAINSPVQSFASDLMLMSMLLLDDLLLERNARIVGTVHDEIFFECREEYLSDLCPIIKHTMEQDCIEAVQRKFGTMVTVPIEAEVSYGQHWDKTGMTVWAP
jgi:uracil-DNA glycosylase family 4